jgi:hypothetical protein
VRAEPAVRRASVGRVGPTASTESPVSRAAEALASAALTSTGTCQPLAVRAAKVATVVAVAAEEEAAGLTMLQWWALVAVAAPVVAAERLQLAQLPQAVAGRQSQFSFPTPQGA